MVGMRTSTAAITNAFTSNKMKVIWYNWILILLLIICFVVSAFASAATSASSTFSFVVIWNALLLIGFSVWGTMVLRKMAWRTPVGVGAMIGISGMFIQIFLENAAVSGANFAHFGLGETPSASDAVTVFSILLIVALFPFTLFLIFFRGTILPAQTTDSTLPPAQYGNYGNDSQKFASSGYRTDDVQVAVPAGETL